MCKSFSWSFNTYKYFETGDMVLVKNTLDEYWIPAIFHSYSQDQSTGMFNVLGNNGNLGDYFNLCIPYKDNEHLAGKKEYPFSYGDMVLVRNEVDEVWLPRIYHSAILKKTGEIRFAVMGHKENASTEYKECAIFNEKFIRTTISMDPRTFKIGYIPSTEPIVVEDKAPTAVEIENVRSVYTEHPEFSTDDIAKNLNYSKTKVEKCIDKIKESIANTIESILENTNE